MQERIRKRLRVEVKKYLSVPAFKRKWQEDQQKGAGYYYALIYFPILSFFKEHQPLSDALDVKVALVFSWNPRICEVTRDRFEQAEKELAALEGSAQRELKAKGILDVDPERVIHELWYPVKKATSKRDTSSGVSVTKYLHFSFPRIFPMIDLKTMKHLSRRNTLDLNSYSAFVLAWKDVYGRCSASFDRIGKATKMPVARVLDVMIFTPR